jgi:alcohol dehydrogenase (NADP+)
LTTYSPIFRNVRSNCTGKTVGIVGVGGLGHFASALGAEIYALSRSLSKKEEAHQLGASHFIAVGEKEN